MATSLASLPILPISFDVLVPVGVWVNTTTNDKHLVKPKGVTTYERFCDFFRRHGRIGEGVSVSNLAHLFSSGSNYGTSSFPCPI